VIYPVACFVPPTLVIRFCELAMAKELWWEAVKLDFWLHQLRGNM